MHRDGAMRKQDANVSEVYADGRRPGTIIVLLLVKFDNDEALSACDAGCFDIARRRCLHKLGAVGIDDETEVLRALRHGRGHATGFRYCCRGRMKMSRMTA